ncbi:MAG: 16S rRNA (cytosine(1402)-N(4))-methyltransferase RsmH [Armatimonadota bacterium]
MTATYAHDPVMVDEILAALALKSGDVVVDGTLGLAGHSMRFIDAIRPGGILVGLDWDESMLAIAKQRVGKPEGVTVHLVHSDFRDMKEVLIEYGIRPNGILLDLGLNSAQIEDPARGITFKEDGPLDMRMDRSKGEPAAALLNRMSPQAIQDALEDFGDEKWAHRIAQKILLRRKEQPLRTTNDLIECVLAAIPVNAREKRIHPATRTFQAIRILTNAEFDGLREAILDAASMLAENGNLAILSYHSGEGRIVKRAYQELAQEGFVLVDKKPRIPSEAEIGRNARSRSAKLRVIRREVKS